MAALHEDVWRAARRLARINPLTPEVIANSEDVSVLETSNRKRTLKAMVHAANGFRDRGNFGRLRSTLLMGITLLGEEFLLEVERAGTLLADIRSTQSFGKFLIRGLLACEPTIEVCGEAVSFSETLYLAATLQPDVILLDLHMPDGDSFESAFVKLRLFSTRSRVLAMSLWQDEETQIIAQSYGAVELLDKGKLFNELIAAIQRLSRD